MNVKLVFIDDEQDILNILRLKLRKLQKVDGVDIVLLESAKEFEEFIMNDQSEVVSVISDINMPDNNVLDVLKKHMPEDKPRYLMGVGTPSDILGAVKRGVDMFDCVMPTRSGRTGLAFTWEGRINIRNSKHQKDNSPLDKNTSNFNLNK